MVSILRNQMKITRYVAFKKMYIYQNISFWVMDIPK